MSDIDGLFEILSDSETMQYYPKVYSRKETAAWIQRSIDSYQLNSFGLWALILKKKNLFIGQCGISLQQIDNVKVPEIGYHINKKFWNQGYASEAASVCLEVAFNDLKLQEIFIHTSLSNIPSRRVAEKTGLIQRKEYDKQVDSRGTIIRHVVYSMSRDEYEKLFFDAIQ